MGIDQERLHVHAMEGTKHAISSFADAVSDGLSFLSETDQLPPERVADFFLKASLTLGCTSLGLSGGGSLGMYHMGVCSALLEEGLLPTVLTLLIDHTYCMIGHT
jgi:NTE family protein